MTGFRVLGAEVSGSYRFSGLGFFRGPWGRSSLFRSRKVKIGFKRLKVEAHGVADNFAAQLQTPVSFRQAVLWFRILAQTLHAKLGWSSRL